MIDITQGIMFFSSLRYAPEDDQAMIKAAYARVLHACVGCGCNGCRWKERGDGLVKGQEVREKTVDTVENAGGKNPAACIVLFCALSGWVLAGCASPIAGLLRTLDGVDGARVVLA